MLARFAIGAALGLLVVMLLFPVAGVDSLPPRCWSIFRYDVPCHRGVAVAAGAAMVGMVGLTLLLSRGRTRNN